MEQARKFIEREPRYVLRPNDSKLIKFAPIKKGNWIRTTEIANISKSGLAFVVNKQTAPPIGEVIKIEFHLPVSDEPVAWFGRVVRLAHIKSKELHSQEEVLVAIHFENLPSGHQTAVTESLREAFNKLRREQRQRKLRRLLNYWREYSSRILWISSALLVFLFAMYWLTRSSENYNPTVPDAWGDRKFRTPAQSPEQDN